MSRRSGDEYSPDPEHDRARPDSTPEPWWNDKDKIGSIFATATIITVFVVVIFLVIIFLIRLAQIVL